MTINSWSCLCFIQLTSRDTVHDLLQYALDRPECCYRTALSVHHNGKRLDNFFEIGSIKDLKDGDTVEVVEGQLCVHVLLGEGKGVRACITGEL